ncbi:hypothetical protein Goshw_016158 [Gossypium schwendimanii]|uniref:Reverse transcriptase domain-containing protein n=1 Tax=Gossypium schwendimanii TaxID=34291 RepID=A0A7J9N6M2_GOSSC|nr:hypothetical protein [Gossypium schwendimanii]
MRKAQKKVLKGVKASRSSPQVSHLLFADDYILFEEASRKGALVFKEILSEYKRCSGQCVNFNNSTVFFSKNTLEEERQLVVNLLRVRSSDELERYLGLPNMAGGKEVFIKAVLQVIPTYSMACFLLPKSLCDEMEGIGLLLKELSWRVGRGNAISIWTDRWIPGIEPESWYNRGGNGELELVSDLIDSTTKMWKTEIITTTFQIGIAQRILQIPLAITDCEGMQVWKGEHSGEFSVRSAYKLLQDASLDPRSYLVQAETKEFYRKL